MVDLRPCHISPFWPKWRNSSSDQKKKKLFLLQKNSWPCQIFLREGRGELWSTTALDCEREPVTNIFIIIIIIFIIITIILIIVIVITHKKVQHHEGYMRKMFATEQLQKKLSQLYLRHWAWPSASLSIKGLHCHNHHDRRKCQANFSTWLSRRSKSTIQTSLKTLTFEFAQHDDDEY